MSNPRLVILGSSLTSLALARHGARTGLKVAVVDVQQGPAMGSRHVEPVMVSGADDGSMLARICPCGGKPESYLIATSDDWIRFLIRHRPVLEGWFDVLHARNQSLETCLDKLAFANWCSANQLPSPRFWVGAEARDAVDMEFPVLVRPASTLHSAAAPRVPKALELHDGLDLARWLDAYDAAGVIPIVTVSLLSQPLVQLSVPFCRRTDGATQTFVARKTRPSARYCRVGSYVELHPDAEAESLVKRAIELLDYKGIGEAEVLHAPDTGSYYLIEINARPWLQYALAPASGHDFLGWLVKKGSGERGPGPARTGYRWIDFRSDLYTCFSRSEGMYWRGELTLGAYLASLAKANVYSKFERGDWRPFWSDSRELFSEVARGLRQLMGKEA